MSTTVPIIALLLVVVMVVVAITVALKVNSMMNSFYQVLLLFFANYISLAKGKSCIISNMPNQL